MSEAAAPSAPTTPAPSAAPAAPSAPAAKPTDAASSAKPTQSGTPVSKTTAATMKSVTSDSPAKPEGETAAEKAERKEAERRKYRYKANKEEVEEELSDDEVALRLAKVRGSEKAFQERADLERQVKDFFSSLKKDPFSVLKEIGVDPESLAEQRLAEKYQRQLEEQSLTPEQKALREKEAEAKTYKEKLEAYEKAQKERAAAAVRQRVETETKTTLESALQKMDINATPEALYEAARLMKLNLQQGIKMTADQIASEVQRRLDDRMERFRKSAVSGLKGEKLLKTLGDEVVKEVIRARLEAMRAPQSFDPPAPAPVEEAPVEKKPFDRAEWRRRNIFGVE